MNFKLILEYVKTIVHAFPISEKGIHAGLSVVSNNGDIIFGFNKYTDTLTMDPAIDAVLYPGTNAAVGKSLSKVKDELFVTSSRQGAIKILVVILGGKSTDDVTVPSEDMKSAGINRVIVVAISSETDKTLFSPPASVPSDVVISVTYMTIKTTAQTVVDKINGGELYFKIIFADVMAFFSPAYFSVIFSMCCIDHFHNGDRFKYSFYVHLNKPSWPLSVSVI